MCGCDQWLHEEYNEQDDSMKDQAWWQLEWSQKIDRTLVRQSEGFLSSAENSLATTRQALAIPSEGHITWVTCLASHSNLYISQTGLPE